MILNNTPFQAFRMQSISQLLLSRVPLFICITNCMFKIQDIIISDSQSSISLSDMFSNGDVLF